MLLATLTLVAAVSAQAQTQTQRPGRQEPPGVDTRQDALRDTDQVRREERLISISKREFAKIERGTAASRPAPIRTFKARVSITNHSAKAIKYVSWMASLTDPTTGAVIRTYPVTTKKRIAPGKTTTLEQKLPIPYHAVVNVAPGSPKSAVVADLKSAVTQVTYEDGSTAERP
jgi:hypothetical protein